MPEEQHLDKTTTKEMVKTNPFSPNAHFFLENSGQILVDRVGKGGFWTRKGGFWLPSWPTHIFKHPIPKVVQFRWFYSEKRPKRELNLSCFWGLFWVGWPQVGGPGGAHETCCALRNYYATDGTLRMDGFFLGSSWMLGIHMSSTEKKNISPKQR